MRTPIILICALSMVALTACSPVFSLRVANFSTPIANSLGQVCWVRVDGTGAPTIGSATFRAMATYDPGAFALTDRVELQVFGRSEAPGSSCTGSDPTADVTLSEPFELEAEATQAIEVGGSAYGAALAGLVNHGTFWLGATAAGNVSLGGEAVSFEDGRITVGF